MTILTLFNFLRVLHERDYMSMKGNKVVTNIVVLLQFKIYTCFIVWGILLEIASLNFTLARTGQCALCLWVQLWPLLHQLACSLVQNHCSLKTWSWNWRVVIVNHVVGHFRSLAVPTSDLLPRTWKKELNLNVK